MTLPLCKERESKEEEGGSAASLRSQRLLLPTLLLRGRLNCVTWHHPTQMTYDNATIKPILARPPGGAARFASFSLGPLYNFYTLVVSKGGHTNHDIIAPLCHLKSRKLYCCCCSVQNYVGNGVLFGIWFSLEEQDEKMIFLVPFF